MNCQAVQKSLSAHLDGLLPDEQRQAFMLHTAHCLGCEQQLQQTVQVRRALRNLPQAVPPAALASRLRVMASRERVRREALHTPWSALAYYRDRLGLWVDNLMRPFALPFAGGLTSAVLVFATLMPSFAFRMVPGMDVPMALYTRASLKATPDMSFGDEDLLVVELTVDERGSMTDYTVTHGQEDVARNPEVRLKLENYLLCTQFYPSTSFGRSIPGRVTISLSRKQITVKS